MISRVRQLFRQRALPAQPAALPSVAAQKAGAPKHCAPKLADLQKQWQTWRQGLALDLHASATHLPGTWGTRALAAHHELTIHAALAASNDGQARAVLTQHAKIGIANVWAATLFRTQDPATTQTLSKRWLYLPEPSFALDTILAKLIDGAANNSKEDFAKALSVWQTALDSGDLSIIMAGFSRWQTSYLFYNEDAKTHMVFQMESLYEKAMLAYLASPHADKSLPVISRLLEATSARVRLATAQHVVKVYAESLSSLQSNSKSQYPEVRLCVALALKRYGRASLSTLQLMTHDANRDVANIASRVINEIRNPAPEFEA